MSKRAHQFVDLLELRGLIGESVAAQLRRYVEDASSDVQPHLIAKILVDRDLLTAAQAKNFLAQLAPVELPGDDTAGRTKAAKAGSEADIELEPLEDELRLAPEDKANVPSAFPGEDDLLPLDDELDPLDDGLGLADDELQPLDDELDLAPIDDAPVPKQGKSTPDEEPVAVKQPVAREAPAGLAPLDDLEDDPLLTASAPGGALQSAKAGGNVKWLRSRWDTPLILVGGGGLLVLILAGAALLFLLMGESADERFAAAEEDYRAQSYTQAISKYEKFLKSHASDDRASHARVRIGLARLRRSAEGASDWQGALSVAGTELPAIENEPAFGEVARGELAGLLPDIAEGFADQAKSSPDTVQAEQYVAYYREAMQLVDNSSYLPSSQRVNQQARIEAIEAIIATVQRDIDRNRELTTAIEGINAAVENGQTAEAYGIRRNLLKAYPGLSSNVELMSAVRRISDRQRQLVTVDDTARAASQEDHPLPSHIKAQVAVARRTGGTADEVAGNLVFLKANGAVYGLDAASGRVRWRRYVGHETNIHPAPVSSAVGADALVYDGVRQEIVRCDATTGKLVWRQTLDSPAVTPVIQSRALFVATREGRILQMDPESGEVLRQASLPQRLMLPPGVDERRPQLYQLSEHSNLYVVSMDTLECQEVFYIGHEAGTVQVPPVATHGCVFVVENVNSDSSRMHLVTTDDNGLGLMPAQDSIRLAGRVIAPPLVTERRVVVVTDRGALYVFEVNKASGGEPVTIVAQTQPIHADSMFGYVLADRGRLWIGDNRLTRYDVQHSRGAITRKWVRAAGDAFVAPMSLVGDLLIHARRQQGLAGISVAATKLDPGGGAGAVGNHVWETQLAVPPAGEVLIDTVDSRQQIRLLSSQGALYDVVPATLQEGVTDEPVVAIDTTSMPAIYSRIVSVDDNVRAAVSDTAREQVLAISPAADPPLTRVVLQVSPGSLATMPLPFAGGLLAPSSIGQVYLLDAKSGRARSLPFQPRLAPGESVPWLPPAVTDDASSQTVISDGSRLYRLAVKEQPQPHLAAVSQIDLDIPLTGRLVVSGDTLFAISRAGGGDTLVTFNLTDWSTGQEWDLEGHVTWGPQRVGDQVLVASQGVGLMSLESPPGMRWSLPLENGGIVGQPLVVDRELLIAFQHGVVARVDQESGQIVASVDVGQPLGCGPVMYNATTLLILGHDGTLFAVTAP